MRQSYQVAGLWFTIAGPVPVLPNLAPFAGDAPASEDELFTLELIPSLPETASTRLFKTDDGPEFPEISISVPEGGGYLFGVSPLPGKPVESRLLTDEEFRHGRLCILGRDRRFALNNALMLMFAFSSACKGVLEMHSSVVMNGGKGYLFLGKSGTGKSTHSSLWIKHIAGSVLLNDDNPILRLMPDGSARVFGSPWSGKTPCYKNEDVPVGAVVRIVQAPFNRIERLSKLEAYASLMASASSFRPFKTLAEGWHRTLEGLAACVPCYTLECLPNEEAAKLSYETIHG